MGNALQTGRFEEFKIDSNSFSVQINLIANNNRTLKMNKNQLAFDLAERRMTVQALRSGPSATSEHRQGWFWFVFFRLPVARSSALRRRRPKAVDFLLRFLKFFIMQTWPE